MKAIHVLTEEPGRPLVWQETTEPTSGPDDALVEIHATALNRADLMQRGGGYPPPPEASEILGLEMAGRIERLGPNVHDWQVGDRVCALLGGGGYAQRVAVPASMLMPIPYGWRDEDAAAIPEAFYTAFVNVFVEAGFRAGETVLMHGGASGVGTALIQLVRQSGGRVIVTVGSEEKAARCRELGADLSINYRIEDFVARIQEYAGSSGVDIIVDMVGADYLDRNIALLRHQGRMVLISTLSGARAQINLSMVLSRRLRLIGSVLRSRSLDERVEIKKGFMQRFWPLLETGVIRPVIDSIYPIEQAAEAQQRMAENKNIGKIVLRVPHE